MTTLRVLAAVVAVMTAPNAASAAPCRDVAYECSSACGGDQRCFNACMRRFGCHAAGTPEKFVSHAPKASN
jgi:hypothetical protein